MLEGQTYGKFDEDYEASKTYGTMGDNPPQVNHTGLDNPGFQESTFTEYPNNQVIFINKFLYYILGEKWIISTMKTLLDSCAFQNEFYQDPGQQQQVDQPEIQAIPHVGEISLREYVHSIIYMPKSMRILCLTNLFCWMSLVCYSLYFTDFVGEAVFGGNPKVGRCYFHLANLS